MKAIPGTDPKILEELGRYVDRMSVNMELPSESSLKLLAPQKSRSAILSPMKFIRDRLQENREERRRSRKVPAFVPAGQTTQLIVGASGESDRQILHLTEALYQRASLKRVYYSAYVPVMQGSIFPSLRGRRFFGKTGCIRRTGCFVSISSRRMSCCLLRLRILTRSWTRRPAGPCGTGSCFRWRSTGRPMKCCPHPRHRAAFGLAYPEFPAVRRSVHGQSATHRSGLEAGPPFSDGAGALLRQRGHSVSPDGAGVGKGRTGTAGNESF